MTVTGLGDLQEAYMKEATILVDGSDVSTYNRIWVTQFVWDILLYLQEG